MYNAVPGPADSSWVNVPVVWRGDNGIPAAGTWGVWVENNRRIAKINFVTKQVWVRCRIFITNTGAFGATAVNYSQILPSILADADSDFCQITIPANYNLSNFQTAEPNAVDRPTALAMTGHNALIGKVLHCYIHTAIRGAPLPTTPITFALGNVQGSFVYLDWVMNL